MLSPKVQQQRDLRKLVRLEEVGNLPGAQDVVDILEKGLVNDLSVIEEEDGRPILDAAQPIQTLDV